MYIYIKANYNHILHNNAVFLFKMIEASFTKPTTCHFFVCCSSSSLSCLCGLHVQLFILTRLRLFVSFDLFIFLGSTSLLTSSHHCVKYLPHKKTKPFFLEKSNNTAYILRRVNFFFALFPLWWSKCKCALLHH